MSMVNTIKYYDENATEFITGTEFADISNLRNIFLSKISKGGLILDWGSGSGRDTKAFLDAGYRVEAVDGSAELARYASDKTGIEVRVESFDELSESDKYDGIWACASILHVECSELPHIFRLAYNALKDNGVMYTSFKYGNDEVIRRGRLFSDMTEHSIKDALQGSNLQIENVWVTSDVRVGREDDKWLNLILVK